MSTSYVQGSIPPVFREELRKPIVALGSDQYQQIDARLSYSNQKHRAYEIAKRRGYIGFDLVQGSSYCNARAVSAYNPID